jgi:hypothetical protein
MVAETEEAMLTSDASFTKDFEAEPYAQSWHWWLLAPKLAPPSAMDAFVRSFHACRAANAVTRQGRYERYTHPFHSRWSLGDVR